MSYESRIPALLAKVDVRVEAANAHTARNVAEEARSRAPRDSGRLASSIKAQPGLDSDWEVVAEQWYGHFVEFGTAHTGAQPFMTPAAESQRAEHVLKLKGLFK